MIIAFTGPQGVGKTTTAKALQQLLITKYNKTSKLFSFADSLRSYAGFLFGADFIAGSKDREKKDEKIDVDLSVLPLAKNGSQAAPVVKAEDISASYRDVLLNIGPGLQKIFGKNIFCYALGEAINDCEPVDYILIDDLRRSNELLWLKNLDEKVFIVELQREDVADTKDYLSWPLTDTSEVIQKCDNPLNDIINLNTLDSIMKSYELV